MIQLLLIFFQAWLISVLHKDLKEEVEKSDNINKAIEVRKKYKHIRTYSVICFFLLNLFVLFCLNWFSNSLLGNNETIIKILFWKIKGWSSFKIIANAILWTIFGYTFGGGFKSFSQYNPINSLSIQDFYKTEANRPFSLYLRGFEKDDYSGESEEKPDGTIFSEQLFANQLYSVKRPLFAVGMSKELTSSNGAKRIYLCDETWKEDVLKLMKCADSIFILVNQKESCIWEIEQSATMLEKVCFLVDDLDQFYAVRRRVEDIIVFPDIEKMDLSLPFSLRMILKNDGDDKMLTPYINKFDNTKKGYEMLIKTLFVKTGKTYALRKKSNQYVLYLKETSLSSQKTRDNNFEFQFVTEMKQLIPVRTITEQRMFIQTHEQNLVNYNMDDIESIIKCMRDAPFIIVPINDKTYGIVKECIALKDKTIFLVNEYYNYVYIKLKFEKELSLPYIDNADFSPFVFYYNRNSIEIEKEKKINLAQVIYCDKISSKSHPWQDIDKNG